MSLRTNVFSKPVIGALMALPLLTASLGWSNPLDAVLRGGWVAASMTEPAEHTAILCTPGADELEAARYRAGLPAVFVALKQAGARAVGIDLTLVRDHESDLEAAAAAARLPVAWGRSRAAGRFSELPKPMAIMVERAEDLSINPQRQAHRALFHTPIPSVVLGTELSRRLSEDELIWPLSLETLALHQGVSPPRWHGESIVVGKHVFQPPHDYLTYLPFSVPELPWREPESWAAVAQGRMVFVGSCEASQAWTRYGRASTAVVHAQAAESVLFGRFPVQVPTAVDVLASFVVGALAFGMRRLVPQFGMVGPVFIGVLAIFVALAASLSHLLPGLSGLLLAAICFGLASEQEEVPRQAPTVYTHEPLRTGEQPAPYIPYGEGDEDEEEASAQPGGWSKYEPEPYQEQSDYNYDDYGEDYEFEVDD